MKLFFLLITFSLSVFSNDCIQCHTDKMKQCKSSNHFTHHNEINIIRKVWGIKESNVTLQTLPNSKVEISKPSDLVDDLLRRKCLRCHLTNKEINPTQNLCLACHNKHQNRFDAFKAKPTQKKCLQCHNNSYIGTDYLGLFPHDYDRSYRSPLTKEGFYPKRPYGIDFHHLSSDIHYQKGLSCIDCHKKRKNKSWEAKVDCRSCHQNLSKQNHKKYHRTISCNACHSSWNISNYELNLLRDDTPNYKQWKRLTVQEDKYLEKFLQKALKSKQPIEPKMPDYLTGKLKKGIWYSGWRFRRWENFFLINDKSGMIKVASPMYQYRISYKDKNGTMILDDVSTINGKKIEAFLPRSPHTITRQAKSCEMCHENKIMLDHTLIDKNILQGEILKGTPLTKKQKEKLQSKKYKKERSIDFFSP